MSHDDALIPASASGAWHELEGRLRPYLARRVNSQADVDDVVQEVFVRIHRGLGELRDEQSFGGWVYRIAERAAADHLRARARHPVADAHAPEPPEVEPELGDEHLQAALTECVSLFVSRLAPAYREALTLTELGGMTQRDAAEKLGISLSGMKSRVQRAREQIRAMFDQCCEVDTDVRGRVLDCKPRALEDVPSDCRGAAIAWASRRKCGD